jgi:hypothetical protein
MSKGKMLAFAVILSGSFVGASDAFVDGHTNCEPCYYVNPEASKEIKCNLQFCLYLRHHNNLAEPADKLKGVLKFRYCNAEATGLLHVETVGTIKGPIFGGAPATEGYIDRKFQDRKAKNCDRTPLKVKPPNR